MSFRWHPHEPPPRIEGHSRAKLKVLRSYLRAYFDRLAAHLPRDEFKLDLVDGFAGGGTFLDDKRILSGTPLIMLEESESARQRLNRDRTKPLRFRAVTRAAYDTPFFIRPERSRRALWFLHLSRHPTARDVMIQCHWNNFNTFEHYGSGDLDMLGWDSLRPEETLRLFHFNEMEAADLRARLLKTMPDELLALASEEPITVDAESARFSSSSFVSASQ